MAMMASGTWRGESAARGGGAYALFQCVIKGHASFERDKQVHGGGSVRVFQIDHQTVAHFGDAFDRTVHFAGSHPHAVAVDRRVGTTVDDQRSAFGQFDPVAMTPDAGIDVEVTGAVARAVGVAPEEERHRGERGSDDQFADITDQRVSLLVEDVDARTQAPALDFASGHREQRAPADEGGADVGAAAE
jgi:hypothetical protein